MVLLPFKGKACNESNCYHVLPNLYELILFITKRNDMYKRILYVTYIHISLRTGEDRVEKRERLMNDLSVQMLATFRSFRSDIGKMFEPYIPWNEFVVLRILKYQNREMVSRVASELNVSNSHITAVSEKLIAKGLLTRFRSELDRRIVYLEITEKGRQLIEEMEQKREGYFQKKFSSLTEEEMEMMVLVLQRLV